MSLFHDAARKYLAESYDMVLSEAFNSEYADLNPEQRKAFDEFVDDEAESMAARFRQVCEAYMMDAPGLPLGVTEDLEGA